MEANWAPTVESTDYFLLFRFYSPTEPPFDKSWPLDDMVRSGR